MTSEMTTKTKSQSVTSEDARSWWSIFSTPAYKDINNSLTDLTVATIEDNARKWLNIIRFTESGSVIQLQDDCEYSITEIINNKQILKKYLGPYYRKYLLKYIPLDHKDLLTAINEALIGLCLSRKISHKNNLSKLSNIDLLNLIAEKGYEVGLFISHVVPLIKSRNFQSLYDLELLVQTSKNLSIIVFSELDITHDKFKKLADKSSFLFDHVIIYPLYDEPDALQFIKFYCDLWHISYREKTAKNIYRLCGGYFWLIHQVLRILRDNPQLSVGDAGSDVLLMSKVEVIWKKFTPEEQNIIRKIYLGSPDERDSLSHEFGYLKRMGVIIETDGKTTFGLPLLSKIIEKEMKLDAIYAKDSRIMIGKNEITSSLSNKERIFMLLLLGAKKKIISREVLAQALWGEEWEEKYSDWAIDVLAFRIRKKLNSIGVEEKLFKTIKKKGFIFG